MQTAKNRRLPSKALPLIRRMMECGMESTHANELRLIQIRLTKWAEDCCNGDIQRDETDGQCYHHHVRVTAGPFLTEKTPDVESRLLKRVAEIMEWYPHLKAFHQTDCRGCALYIIRPGDVPAGKPVGSFYDRGLAVCC